MRTLCLVKTVYHNQERLVNLGSRKPDGIIYRTEEQQGVIIDTKAYSNGYSLPISQADEMSRYIRENQTRDIAINPNCWWSSFPENVTNFNFAFISSVFRGNINTSLQRIALDTGVNGVAINVLNMLLTAEKIKANQLTYVQFFNSLNANAELS